MHQLTLVGCNAGQEGYPVKYRWALLVGFIAIFATIRAESAANVWAADRCRHCLVGRHGFIARDENGALAHRLIGWRSIPQNHPC